MSLLTSGYIVDHCFEFACYHLPYLFEVLTVSNLVVYKCLLSANKSIPNLVLFKRVLHSQVVNFSFEFLNKLVILTNVIDVIIYKHS